MSIQSPVGTLDIKNATLRVGKLEVSNIQGVDTALNVTRANSVLIYDDQVSTTTFNGFTSSGVRDTGNGYLDVADGYVYWGQKLPNSWVMDFEMDIRSGTNGGPLYANVFSTTNTGGDGYSFTFNDSNNKISLYYDSTLLTETTVSGLFTASEDWQKVVINYERGLIAISLDGSRKFYYKDIERETPYVNGEYVSFSSASTDGRKIRDLRIVNGEKWVYSGESNVVYTQGSVGIGVTDPTVALDVSGTVKATVFDGDGSAITNISSANVGDFTSNVVRIETLETDLDSNATRIGTLETDLVSNVTRIETLETDLDSNATRIGTLETDLVSNVTRIENLESGDITISGTKTFQDDVVLESNLRVQGDLLVANTVNMTVSDPILELGSNNLNTGDVGIVMTRHGASNSNVAIFFDETADTLKLGYTLNGANDTTLEFDSNALAVSVQGALTVGSNLEVGTANLFVDTTTSNVGVGTDAPAYKLDVHGSANVGAITLNSNVYAPNLHLAEIASNLVTWDSATGDLMDSGGLISNKLAIVSEQPPAALTGDSTVVDGHGRYKVTSSSEGSEPDFGDWNCFNKATGGNNAWSSDQTYDTVTFLHDGTQSIGGIDGEWVKLELPYKTLLRHISLQARSEGDFKELTPGTFSIIGSNDDSSWTLLKQITGVAASDYSSVTQKQFVIDASASYKYYALVVEKIAGGSYASTNPRTIIGEWRLFTETLTVDAGVVSTTAASGLDVGYTEHPVVPLTGSTTYNANIGTTGEFPPSTHYVEGHGTYEAWASTQYNVSGQATREVWKLFDGSTSTYFQQSSSTGYDNYNGSSPYEYVGTRGTTTTDVGGTRYMGVWVQLKLPYTITLAYTKINNWTSNTDRSPGAGVILGSNDGDNWYKLTEFSGLTYTSNEEIVQVNATTPYQYYRMVATNTVGSGSINFTEWRLFAEKPVTRMENVHISGELSSETLQTGYIKWPKVPLKANESEGYVVTASSEYGSTYQAFYAFDDQSTIAGVGTAYAWVTPQYTFDITTGDADSANCATFDNLSCEWIQLQSPNPFAVSYFDFDRRETTAYNSIVEQETPREGYLYASNDGVTWTRLTYFSNLPKLGPHDWERVNVGSNEAYMYYRLVVTKVHPNGTGAYLGISNLRFFEAATGVGAAPTSAKLQVAGSLGMAKGSEFFAGDDVVMELPKHDRPLTKYPEVAMTAATTAGYTASASRFDAAYYPYKAFNGLKGGNSGDVGWHTGTEPAGGIADYTGTSNTYVGTERLSSETVLGEWITIELPKPIKLKETHLWAQFNYSHVPKGGVFYGKRNASDTWTRLYSYTERSIRDRYNPQVHIINETRYFKYFAYVATERYLSASGISVGEWELYGYEEGDTSVDVVHRSIPNRPGQQHLEVYWDANDSNSYSFADSSNVYDLSGNGRTGTLTNNVTFDSTDNGWITTSTTTSGITGSFAVSGGDWVHSVSYWVKVRALPPTSVDYLFGFASAVAYNSLAHYIKPDGTLVTGSWTLDYPTSNFTIPVGEWFHVTTTYKGGGFSPNVNAKTYINGELKNMGTNISSGTDGTALGIPTTAQVVYVGYGYGGAATSPEATYGNFRMYSNKALNAEQVRELYEYDAPRFGHRQNLVALHKGCLGVGVAHPTSRFEVAGADGLQEYPPKAMTGFETYMEGHGVFKVHKSGDNTYIGVWPAWEAFNEVFTDAYHGGNFYTGTDYAYAGTETLGGISGDYVILELPYKIKAKQISLAPYPTIDRTPEDFTILGSNDNVNWTKLATFNGITNWTSGVYKSFNINSDEYFNHFAVVVTRLVADQYFMISEIKYYGTPAPSAIEDGHLTLGKALTLPRVSGHPAGAETPRAESLVVHYDTTVDSVVSGTTVVDISGEGANGTLTNGAAYSSTDRALTFDRVNDYLKGSITASGNFVHSISMWFKPTVVDSSVQMLFFMSSNGGTDLGRSIIFFDSANGIGFDFRSKGIRYLVPPVANQWMHLVCTYDGNLDGSGSNDMKIYINGVKATNTAVSGASSTLNLINGTFWIGNTTGSSQHFGGSISNFKLWDVALTAEEVAAEYALGRTGKSINLTDTSLCLGGTVPRAQLDATLAHFDRLNIGPSSNSGHNPRTNALLATTTNGSNHAHLNNEWRDVWFHDFDENWNFKLSQYHNAGVDVSHAFRWQHGAGQSDNYMSFKGANVGIGVTNPTVGLNLNTDKKLAWIPTDSYLGAPTTAADGGVGSRIMLWKNSGSVPYGFGMEGGAIWYCSGGIHKFYIGTTHEASITTAGPVSTFTGQHRCTLGQVTNEDLVGRIVVAENNKYVKMNDGVETGSNAITINECLPVLTLSTKSNQKSCFGVVSSGEDADGRQDKYGNFISHHVKEAGDTRYVINSVGEGAMWVTDINGSLESGDYITTSNVAGYGQRQDDDVLHNYTVAKITMDCDFNPPDIPVQRILKELSNVNYWVKTMVSNVSLEEYSNLAEDVRTTTTEIYYSNEDGEITTLESNVQSTYTELTRIIYQKISTEEYKTEQEGSTLEVRQELVNVLDEHGQLQWEDDPSGATEKAYKIRYLTADGQITDEANAVHTAAFVGVTYHCG
jgi:hypothetical protein